MNWGQKVNDTTHQTAENPELERKSLVKTRNTVLMLLKKGSIWCLAEVGGVA